MRPEAALLVAMDGHVEDARVVVEGPLGALAVVKVEVHDEDAAGAGRQRLLRRYHHVVVTAESKKKSIYRKVNSIARGKYVQTPTYFPLTLATKNNGLQNIIINSFTVSMHFLSEFDYFCTSF